MRRITILIYGIVLLVFIIIQLFINPTYADIINITADYTTIQEGINTANDGDTVLVQPGTYVENINYNGKNITVASLFLTTQDTTYISQTIIDGNQNGSVVTFENGEDSTTILTGFAITNGAAEKGAGIYCYSSSPSLLNLVIIDNSASYGGGIYCYSSSSSLKDITIANNSANYGGGIYCNCNSILRLENVKLRANSVTGVSCAYGGGIYCKDDSNLSLSRVTIINNTATIGGGISCIRSTPNFNNITITGNHAGWDGGGIYCSDSSPDFENVTLTDNYSYYYGGGIYFDSNSNPCFVNSILWNDLPEEIYFSQSFDPCTITISYSDIQGGYDGIAIHNNGTVNWLEGNIDVDPLFIDPDNENYHLSWTNFPIPDSSKSPCIDTGDPSTLQDPDGTIADMGAYYFDQSGIIYPPTADFSADPTSGVAPLTVNFTDQSILGTGVIEEWQWDFDYDGTIDSYEQNPQCTYNEIGTYSVSLTVADENDSTDTETKVDYITVTDSGPNFEWCTIPAGEYTYGQGDTIKTIDYDFQIMKYEVTNYQYKTYLEEALAAGVITVTTTTVEGYYEGDEQWSAGTYEFYDLDATSSYNVGYINWNSTYGFTITEGYENHPVIFVTWFGAWAFAQHYGLRLPTEHEWEKASRGNTGWDYPWGDNIDGSCANYNNSGDPWDNGTTPVGYYNGQNYEGFQTTDSPSPYGVYDMAGNVWDWCDSFWSGTSSSRVIRGGSWYRDTGYLHSWSRGSGTPPSGSSYGSVGFRCAMNLQIEALFEADPTSGYAPLTVNFTDQSIPGTGAIEEWYWDFGDENNSNDQNPTHEFINTGTYTVSLTVTDEYDSTATEIKENYITVYPEINIINIPDDYPTIQEGINVAVNGDTVLVQPGTYVENINYNGKNITVGSLFLTTQDTSYISQTVIDGSQPSNPDSASVVIFENGEDSTAVLSGFTLTNGSGTNNGYNIYGGGIYCMFSSPSITNCIVIENSAYYSGGGILCGMYSSPSIKYCSIISNTATLSGGIGCGSWSNPLINNCSITNNTAEESGGGIYCDSSAYPTITDCSITNNIADYSGGIGCTSQSSLIINNCTITDNSAVEDGGGIGFFSSSAEINDCIITGNTASNKGGGIHCENSSNPYITDCTISNNQADDGGGFYINNSNPTIDSCSFISNIALGNVFFGNGGGGIHCYESSPIINNCEFIENVADTSGGAILCRYYSSPLIENCLFLNNSASHAQGGIAIAGDCNPIINACIFRENHSNYVGGIGVYTRSNPMISNCVFNRNYTTYNMCGNLDIWNECNPIITQCTFIADSASTGGQIWITNSDPEINTSIIHNSLNGEGIFFDNSPNAEIKYCDISGNADGAFGGDVPEDLGNLVTTNVNGDSCDIYYNIFLEPQFIDPGNDDFHLLSTSPCIDAGYPLLPLDPDNTIADMGAFYFNQSGILGTIEGTVILAGGSGNVEEVELTADGIIVYPDSNGYYEMTIEPGIYDVSASLEEYVDSTVIGVEVFEGQSTNGIDFILYEYTSCGNIKINEILYDPVGPDLGNEWIELYNADSTLINLENWKIEKAGTYFSVCFTFPDISIASEEFLLIGESNVANADLTASLAFQNAGTATDGVRIISAEGDTIDTILYDSPNSNNLPGDANQPGIYFAPDVPSGHSLMRFPDGFDTDNCENDFFDCANPTPGYSNTVNSNIQGTITLSGGTGIVDSVEVTANGVTVHPYSNGDYIIVLNPGIYDVTASLEGYEDSTIAGVEVFEGQSTTGIDFILYSFEEPDIFIDPDSLAFGNVTIGAVSSIKSFYIFNQGNVDLDIFEISTPEAFEIKKGDAGDWVTNILDFIILDNSFQKIYVRFIPTDTGSYSNDISISSNDPDEDTLFVNVSGIGVEYTVPNIEINPAEILFGSVTISTSKEELFSISNTGSAELVIDSIYVPANSVFMIRLGDSGAYYNYISGFSILVENEQDIYVEFIPPAIGQYSTYITIKSNVGSDFVNVSGTGVEYDVPDIDVNPVELHFGGVPIYQSVEDTITIMNTGNAILEINNIFSLSGYEIKLDDGSWGNNIPAFDIPPLGEEIIYVKFHPEALITYNGVIYITSNDPDEGSIPVLVEGQGIPVLSEIIPDAFTPNGDGLNDEFIIGPFVESGTDKAQFKVYDLHGKMIHETKGSSNEALTWDGNDNSGNKCISGAYIYVYLINDNVYKRGKIYLIR